MSKTRKKPEATPEEREKFEQFLFEMDDVLDELIGQAREGGCDLDFSLDSLLRLEQFLVANLEGEETGRLENRAARYLGEVFRKVVGGKWELCLKDPKYLYFKLPVIAGYSRKPIEFCPIQMIANFLVRRKPGFLKRVVEADLEFKSG